MGKDDFDSLGASDLVTLLFPRLDAHGDGGLLVTVRWEGVGWWRRRELERNKRTRRSELGREKTSPRKNVVRSSIHTGGRWS